MSEDCGWKSHGESEFWRVGEVATGNSLSLSGESGLASRLLPRFRLVTKDQSYELPAGESIIGRAEDCSIMLEDLRMSRHHARLSVSEDSITIEDLDSRNGVVVNNNRITQPVPLGPGDVLLVGSTVFRVLTLRKGHSLPERYDGPTLKFESFGVVGALAEKAIAMGRLDEAIRLLEGPLAQLLAEVKLGPAPSEAAIQGGARLALRLLEATGRGEWLDWLVKLYRALGQPFPASTVEVLYAIVRRVVGPDVVLLRSYCQELRRQERELGPSERFLVGRIEGLLRLIECR